MKGKRDLIDMPKYETCRHADPKRAAGQLAVYVRPSCPRLSMIKGTLVSSKGRCRECKSYEKRRGK